MTRLKENYYDEDLADIEKSLNEIKDEYTNVMKDRKYDITEALAEVYTAKSKLRSLKIVLNILANSTISRVDRLIKSLEKFEKATGDERIKRYFQGIVRKMKTILSRSDRNLKEALEMYEESTKRLNAVKTYIGKFVIQLKNYIENKDGKLEEWIKTYRKEGYGMAAACVFIPPLCPLIFALTATGLEVTIAKAKKNLKYQKVRLDAVQLATNKLVDQVHNGLDIIKNEEPLIRYWAEKVQDVQDELPSAEILVKDIQDDFADLEQLKETLVGLRDACQKYIAHS